MNWSKFLSRKFLVAMALKVIATAAMFYGLASFVEWSVAVGGFATIWMGSLTVQKVKGANILPPQKE